MHNIWTMIAFMFAQHAEWQLLFVTKFGGRALSLWCVHVGTKTCTHTPSTHMKLTPLFIPSML